MDAMVIVERACDDIMRKHGPGHTECFYEKLLSHHLYEKCVPFLTQVDCYIQEGSTQVQVGRIDMEVCHHTILEFKVGACVRQQDMAQLDKYVRAREAMGASLKCAAVVCFRSDGAVEVCKRNLLQAVQDGVVPPAHAAVAAPAPHQE